MSKTTAAARTTLRAAVTSALIVLVTGAGLQTSWADEPVPATGTSATAGATPEGCDPADTTGTDATGTPTCTENNPWD